MKKKVKIAALVSRLHSGKHAFLGGTNKSGMSTPITPDHENVIINLASPLVRLIPPDSTWIFTNSNVVLFVSVRDPNIYSFSFFFQIKKDFFQFLDVDFTISLCDKDPLKDVSTKKKSENFSLRGRITKIILTTF